MRKLVFAFFAAVSFSANAIDCSADVRSFIEQHYRTVHMWSGGWTSETVQNFLIEKITKQSDFEDDYSVSFGIEERKTKTHGTLRSWVENYAKVGGVVRIDSRTCNNIIAYKFDDL